MKQVVVDNVPLWQFNTLTSTSRVQHFVTGRHSYQAGLDFNFSYSNAEDHDEITRNRSMLAQALGIGPAKLRFCSQVHLTNIVRVDGSTERQHLMNTDAMITNEPGIGLAVMSADCVPVLLYDRTNHAIGAIHSGWRGTVARILEKTLEAMRQSFGTQGENLIAAIGPSVSQASYEVGEEVIRATQQSFGDQGDALLQRQPNGKAKLDLWSANKIQLLDFGVPEEQIELSGRCTVLENQHFFSARKGDRGRFAAAIVLR